MKAINQWGQGPSGVSQRFANPGLYDIQRASYELQQNVDPDTAEKLQKQTNKMIDDAQDSDTPGLPSLKRAQGGNVVATKQSERFNPYKRPPHNNAGNDYHQGYQVARGSGDYSSGKMSPRFSNQSAEIQPHGHNGATPRRRARGGKATEDYAGGGQAEDYLSPAQRRAYESQSRFAKGGAAKMTPAWKDCPYPVTQRTPKGLKIHAPHSGEGLVMNIHLSDVGPNALSLRHSGGVNVERMAQRNLQSDARMPATNPFQQGGN